MQDTARLKAVPTQYSDRTAIAHLRQLYITDCKVKHPELPYYSSPPFKASKTNDLTRCVSAFLKLKGHFCERTGVEGRVMDQRQTVTDILGNRRIIGDVRRVKSSGKKGTSDLKAIINGRFVAIEVKNCLTRDRQRPDQKHYQAEVEASQGLYIICTSFAQFVNWYYANTGGIR